MFPAATLESPPQFKTGFTVSDLTGNGTLKVNVISDTGNRVTVVLDTTGIYAVYLVCTHLGCTPNYVSDVTSGTGVTDSSDTVARHYNAEGSAIATRNGWACPCHGSRYYIDSTNFYGPAPRPMDWVDIQLAPGQPLRREPGRHHRVPSGRRQHACRSGGWIRRPARATDRRSGCERDDGRERSDGGGAVSARPTEGNPLRAFAAQIWGSIFRHGLPTTDKVAARTALTNFFLHIHPVRVKKSAIRVSYTLCLGGLSFFLFILLTISGLFLMFYYIPSVDQAYQNIKDLQFVATFGLVIRNLHRWAAHGMVITVWLHMARVFYQGAYKPPREFNWAIGTFLLLITLLLSFSGYLLPWDQLAVWAITVGTNMAKYAPIAGPYTRYLLLGGRNVGQGALIRFYVLHVVALPLIGFILMVIHFWRVRKDGFTGGL